MNRKYMYKKVFRFVLIFKKSKIGRGRVETGRRSSQNNLLRVMIDLHLYLEMATHWNQKMQICTNDWFLTMKKCHIILMELNQLTSRNVNYFSKNIEHATTRRNKWKAKFEKFFCYEWWKPKLKNMIFCHVYFCYLFKMQYHNNFKLNITDKYVQCSRPVRY